MENVINDVADASSGEDDNYAYKMITTKIFLKLTVIMSNVINNVIRAYFLDKVAIVNGDDNIDGNGRNNE